VLRLDAQVLGHHGRMFGVVRPVYGGLDGVF
jgi:hypothetical protein